MKKLRMKLAFIFIKFAISLVDKNSLEGITFIHAIREWVKYIELSYESVNTVKKNEN